MSETGGDPGTPAEPSPARERMDLPNWNRARHKRNQPAGGEADGFQRAVGEAGRGAARKAPWLLLGVLGLTALVAGGLYLREQAVERDARATRLFAEGLGWIARGRVGDVEVANKSGRPPPNPMAKDEAELEQTADRELGRLVEEAPDSEARRLARLVAAARHLRARDFAGAEGEYRQFLADEPADHTLAFMAREGLIFALEGKGALDEALAEVERLVGDPGAYFRDEALWHKGRLLEAAGRRDDAVAVYRQYWSEFPPERSSLAREPIRARLAELDPAALAAAEPALDPAAVPGTAPAGEGGG